MPQTQPPFVGGSTRMKNEMKHPTRQTMKRAFLLLSLFSLITLRVIAADTNLNQSITVQRPLNDVIGAMQTYYFSTNYHGFASAVYSTNAVPGVSYTLGIADCAFNAHIGGLFGEMVATRDTAASTKLELVVKIEIPKDSITTASVKQTISKTLERVAKIAEGKR
jgi:hypothetical protein